jgi:hypothetical protein
MTVAPDSFSTPSMTGDLAVDLDLRAQAHQSR